MTYRVGWLSPLTPTSGVGTFTHAITRQFPRTVDGEPVDLTVLYVGHDKLYRSAHRSIQISGSDGFHQVLTLFDLLVYNIGNNREHHDPIFALLRLHPGILICHDYVYQHYLADCSLRSGKSFASFAALLSSYGGAAAADQLRRSRITNRIGRARYSPWDSETSVRQPMSEAILALGSALVVHSSFAQRYAEECFEGPILRLGMPHDQRPGNDMDLSAWARQLVGKQRFELVSLGHIQATKCIDLVISAIAASPILRRRIHYNVAGFVGDSAYFDRLKAMVTALSLQDCVTFELEVSEKRLGELLQRADIFSNLRRPNTEGASVSLIEQLDTGKPVIVFDSGCYADVPTNAAIKLSPDVGRATIQESLEQLVENPTSLPTIGRAGRVFARSWTCSAYARELLRFAIANRAMLETRARFDAIHSRPVLAPVGHAEPFREVCLQDAWVDDLARARLKLTYLDRNMLAVDPAIVFDKTSDGLCEYVAHVLLGMFDKPQLQRALSRFFVRLDRRAAYWACVRFALLADAVFGDDEAARERLINLRPCHEPEFWSVVEALPARQYLAAATLMLARRPPKGDELSITGLDDQDGFPKRLRIVDLVRSLKPAPDSSLERLGRWLETPCSPALERELPPIERDFECAVGSPAFIERVDLSGFYSMETDHAWTRGGQGFFGLRLGDTPVTVEVLVRHISASPERPASIRISVEDRATSIEAEDCAPRWMSVALPPAATPTKTLWWQITTDVAAVPANSHDTRLLGICFLRVRVRARESASTRVGPRAAGSVSIEPIDPRSSPLDVKKRSLVRGA